MEKELNTPGCLTIVNNTTVSGNQTHPIGVMVMKVLSLCISETRLEMRLCKRDEPRGVCILVQARGPEYVRLSYYIFSSVGTCKLGQNENKLFSLRFEVGCVFLRKKKFKYFVSKIILSTATSHVKR